MILVRSTTRLICVFAFALTALACASPPAGPVLPDWASRDCHSYWPDGAGNVLCGVGAAGYSRDERLLRYSAVQRSHAQIAEQLDEVLQTILGADETLRGRLAADARRIRDETARRSQLVTTWSSETDGFYALSSLDLAGFKKAVSELPGIEDEVRKKVLDGADAAFGSQLRNRAKG